MKTMIKEKKPSIISDFFKAIFSGDIVEENNEEVIAKSEDITGKQKKELLEALKVAESLENKIFINNEKSRKKLKDTVKEAEINSTQNFRKNKEIIGRENTEFYKE